MLYPNVKIIESITGKFGLVIKGEVDGVYFRVNCGELENGKILIHDIESDYCKNTIKEVLIWQGHVDF